VHPLYWRKFGSLLFVMLLTRYFSLYSSARSIFDKNKWTQIDTNSVPTFVSILFALKFRFNKKYFSWYKRDFAMFTKFCFFILTNHLNVNLLSLAQHLVGCYDSVLFWKFKRICILSARVFSCWAKIVHF
jgi:hypothetical protein